MKDEDAYHMMPLLTFNNIALHNFMDWIGVKHFTGFLENLPEFHLYPLLANLVNSYNIMCTIRVFQALHKSVLLVINIPLVRV